MFDKFKKGSGGANTAPTKKEEVDKQHHPDEKGWPLVVVVAICPCLLGSWWRLHLPSLLLVVGAPRLLCCWLPLLPLVVVCCNCFSVFGPLLLRWFFGGCVPLSWLLPLPPLFFGGVCLPCIGCLCLVSVVVYFIGGWENVIDKRGNRVPCSVSRVGCVASCEAKFASGVGVCSGSVSCCGSLVLAAAARCPVGVPSIFLHFPFSIFLDFSFFMFFHVPSPSPPPPPPPSPCR